MLEYLGVEDKIKTDNPREDNFNNSRVHIRTETLRGKGFKVEHIDFYDLINFTDDRAGLVNKVKEKIGKTD